MGGAPNPFSGPTTTVDQNQINQNAKDVQDLKNAQSDPNIDPVTKSELAKGVAGATNTGKGDYGINYGDVSQLLDQLAAAKAGTGLYGVRKVNQAQKNLITSSPGRAQLTPSLGGNSTLGSFF